MIRLLAGLVFFSLLCSPVLAEKPVLSLVIDDLGYSFEPAKQALNLPGEHTYAVIPNTAYGKRIAQYAHQSGREIILHMPMQSSLGNSIESFALHENMSEDEITQSVMEMIKAVPHIKGINNHMGSKLTEMGYIMRPVMETIKKSNNAFYFLDSRTSALSQAYQQALRAGVPTQKRDIFLDYNHANTESISFQFKRWLNRAKEKGHAIAIGHPHPSTIDVLTQALPDTFEDFSFKTISQLIEYQQQEKTSWPRYLSHLLQDSKNSKPSP